MDRFYFIFFEAWDQHFRLTDIVDKLEPYGVQFIGNFLAGFKQLEVGFVPSVCKDIIATKVPERFSPAIGSS